MVHEDHGDRVRSQLYCLFVFLIFFCQCQCVRLILTRTPEKSQRKFPKFHGFKTESNGLKTVDMLSLNLSFGLQSGFLIWSCFPELDSRNQHRMADFTLTSQRCRIPRQRRQNLIGRFQRCRQIVVFQQIKCNLINPQISVSQRQSRSISSGNS